MPGKKKANPFAKGGASPPKAGGSGKKAMPKGKKTK